MSLIDGNYDDGNEDDDDDDEDEEGNVQSIIFFFFLGTSFICACNIVTFSFCNFFFLIHKLTNHKFNRLFVFVVFNVRIRKPGPQDCKSSFNVYL